jgi:hypothetical protein
MARRRRKKKCVWSSKERSEERSSWWCVSGECRGCEGFYRGFALGEIRMAERAGWMVPRSIE